LDIKDQDWAYLLRVGADSTYYGGGFHGPIFDGFSFEFIPIPEYETDDAYRESNYGQFTYGNTYDRKCGQPFTEYIRSPKIRNSLQDRNMHLDPDFDNATYGDLVRTWTNHQLKFVSKAASLQYLIPGNLLVFCASLDPYKTSNCQRALHMIGYFEVKKVHDFQDLTEDERWSKCKEFRQKNAHCASASRDDMNKADYKYLVLIEGKPKRSTLLDRAIQLTDEDYRILPIWTKELGLNPTAFFRGGRWLPQKRRDQRHQRQTYVARLLQLLDEHGRYHQNLRKI